jgi:hypothetical protein
LWFYAIQVLAVIGAVIAFSSVERGGKGEQPITIIENHNAIDESSTRVGAR